MSSLTAEIAATAARIIIDSELTDWRLARRKALGELDLPAHGTPLPADEEIIEAWNALPVSAVNLKSDFARAIEAAVRQKAGLK